MESAVDLHDLLERLDLPDCDCTDWTSPCECPIRLRTGKCKHIFPWHPRCAHILSSDHDLTQDEWLLLMHAAHGQRTRSGDDYAERPPAREPAMVLTQAARVAIMAGRFDRGEHLYHPQDLRQEDADDVSIQVHRLVTNGRIVEDGLVSKRAA